MLNQDHGLTELARNYEVPEARMEQQVQAWYTAHRAILEYLSEAAGAILRKRDASPDDARDRRACQELKAVLEAADQDALVRLSNELVLLGLDLEVELNEDQVAELLEKLGTFAGDPLA